MSISISSVFEELFYGSGSWLGLLLFLAIITALTLKAKYTGLLMLPVTVFLAIDYLSYPSLLWHSVIMFLASVFIIIQIAKGKTE